MWRRWVWKPSYYKTKKVKPLFFWRTCEICGKQFRREPMYRTTRYFHDQQYGTPRMHYLSKHAGHLQLLMETRYFCEHCCPDIGRIQEYMEKLSPYWILEKESQPPEEYGY